MSHKSRKINGKIFTEVGIYIIICFLLAYCATNIPIRQPKAETSAAQAAETIKKPRKLPALLDKNALKERNFYKEKQAENVIEEPSNLYAKAAVLMDGDSGRVLFNKNGEEAMPNASTTKILTCILALENGNLEDTVTVSDYAASMPEVALGMQSGEQYVLKDLLYSLMLESHNDTAVAIAEHIAGDVTKFAAMMNEKAKSIGCTDTFFVTPNGLDSEAADETGTVKPHGTSARDLALMLRYCLFLSPQREVFKKITTTPDYSFSSLNSGRQVSCYNHNTFLNMMEGASSGKTGYTGKAGYCYVGSLTDGGRNFIVALLACGWPNHKTYKWEDTKKLMNYGLENYHYREIDMPCEFSPIPVENGISKTGRRSDTAYVTIGRGEGGEETKKLLLRDDEQVNIQYEYAEKLTAPVKANQEIGRAIYSLNGIKLSDYPIITLESVDEMNLKWCVQKVIGQLLTEIY